MLFATTALGVCGAHAEAATWADETRILDDFSCAGNGVDRLVISGEVVLRHTEQEEPFVPLDMAREIRISCDNLHFEPGSVLRANSNLRIVVDRLLSGAVNIESDRGVPGLDAPSIRVTDLARHKAANGVEGSRGGDGSNATEFKDGTRGHAGGTGHPGSPGGKGVEGLAGSDGADASNIHLTTMSVSADTTLRLAAVGGEGGAGGRGGRGEDGGDGGRGGHGGKGGDASHLHDAERGGDGGPGGQGGSGGTGGTGGRGGRGGAGGQAFFYIVENGGRLSEAGTYVTHGGKGGFPGIGGAPGKGGKGGPGGFPGGGGRPEDLDLGTFVTLGWHRVILGDGLEVEWHGEGDTGNLGAWGAPGPDGRAGPIGAWGRTGPEGEGGQLFVGIVSLKDFRDYRSSLGM